MMLKVQNDKFRAVAHRPHAVRGERAGRYWGSVQLPTLNVQRSEAEGLGDWTGEGACPTTVRASLPRLLRLGERDCGFTGVWEWV